VGVGVLLEGEGEGEGEGDCGCHCEGDCERCRSCTAQSRGSVDGSVNASARRVGAREAKASLRSFRVAARASIMVLGTCWMRSMGVLNNVKVIKTTINRHNDNAIEGKKNRSAREKGGLEAKLRGEDVSSLNLVEAKVRHHHRLY
jgi:hypothetical protein